MFWLTLLFGVATAAVSVLSIAGASRRDGIPAAAASAILGASFLCTTSLDMVLPHREAVLAWSVVDLAACGALAALLYPAVGGRLTGFLAVAFAFQSGLHMLYQGDALAWPLYIRGLNLVYSVMLLAAFWENRRGSAVLSDAVVAWLHRLRLVRRKDAMARSTED